jgi:hypothetical protein
MRCALLLTTPCAAGRSYKVFNASPAEEATAAKARNLPDYFL